MAGVGTVLFKFRNARGEPESVQFDGYHISAVELKNLIAEKKGIVDGTLELSDPKTKAVFEDSHVFPRGSAVTVRRVAASKAAPRAQHAAAATDAAEEAPAGPAMATLQAMTAQNPMASAVDPNDEKATLEQRKAGQGREDLQIAALVDAQNEAWRAQTDKNILASRAREQQLAAQRGRGRGFGSQYMHGRGRGHGGQGYGFCKYCGKLDEHFSDDCPQKHNPRTDLRHVRAPAGIPAELLEASNEGGLLLNTGKTGALKSSTAQAAKEFAALPTAARRSPALPALADAPHEQQQEPRLLENGRQQQQEEPDEAEQELQQLEQDEDDEQQEQQPEQPVADDGAAATAGAEVDAEFDDDGFGFDDGAMDSMALFDDDDDDDLAPPAGAAAGGAKLNLGMGMDLVEPAAEEQAEHGGDGSQQQQEQLPRADQQQQQSPVSQAPQQAALPGAVAAVAHAFLAACACGEELLGHRLPVCTFSFAHC